MPENGAHFDHFSQKAHQYAAESLTPTIVRNFITPAVELLRMFPYHNREQADTAAYTLCRAATIAERPASMAAAAVAYGIKTNTLLLIAANTQPRPTENLLEDQSQIATRLANAAGIPAVVIAALERPTPITRQRQR